jgi:regulator of Ty1 transposition protein 103
LISFQDLENSASSDAIIREKIAQLPPELSEASHLESLQTYEDGQKLLVKVRLKLRYDFKPKASSTNRPNKV